MPATTESVLASLAPQLSRLEKRDWELWIIVSVAGILVSVGLLALIVPAAFLENNTIHFEITVPRPVAIGLIVVIALLNTYLVTRRMEIRRVREELISTNIQKQLIEQQSLTDPLTEIYNRRSLNEVAGRYTSQASRRGKPLTFLMVDIDNFKQVNTKLGRLTGDTVLAEFATLLKCGVRGSDAVVRYGGDEFLVILADTNVVGAQIVIERIAKHLAEWNGAGHLKGFKLEASFGIAEWHDGLSLDEALDAADKKMYEKKVRTSAAIPLVVSKTSSAAAT